MCEAAYLIRRCAERAVEAMYEMELRGANRQGMGVGAAKSDGFDDDIGGEVDVRDAADDVREGQLRSTSVGAHSRGLPHSPT